MSERSIKKYVMLFLLSMYFLTIPNAGAQLWHKGGAGLGVNVGYEFSAEGGIVVGLYSGTFHRVEGAIVGALAEVTFYLQTGKLDASVAGEFRTVRSSEPQSYGGRLGVVFGEGPGVGWRITGFIGTAAALYSNISFLPYRTSGIQLGLFARATEELGVILPIR